MIVAAVRERPAVAMACATGASRITGLVRTLALAAALGVTAVGDAYNTANTVPNMVFTLVVGGILTSAVVPVLVAYPSGGESGEAAGAVLGVTLVIGAAASVALVVGAPFVVRVLASGAADRSEYGDYVRLTTTWLRWFAPQVAFYGVGVLAVSIMTVERRLFLGAAAPIVTNLITTAVALLALDVAGLGVAGVSSTHMVILGAGTTVAVAAATIIQLFGAYRAVPGLRLRWRPRHPAVTSLGKRAGWMVVYVTSNQLGLAAIVALATASPGVVSAYMWAFILMQLPYALISVSVLTASYADISRAVHDRKSVDAEVRRVGSTSLRWLTPASVGLAFVAVPLATVLVGTTGALLLAVAVVWFAASLVPFSIYQLLARVLYAHQDTRTPALTNILVNAVNVVAAVLLIGASSSPTERLRALVIANGLSYVVGVITLGAILVRRRVLALASITGDQRATAVGASCMAAALWLATQWVNAPQSRLEAAIDSAGLITLGLVVYGGVIWTIGSWGRPAVERCDAAPP